MAGTYVMALDAGGGGGHCLLADLDSGATTRAFRAWTHPVAPGTGGLGTDLDLDRIWRALADAAREALHHANVGADAVVGIAATSMRHTTVVLGADGAAVCAMPNRDSRAVTEAFQFAMEHGSAVYARTGHWPSPVCTAMRLRWLNVADPSWSQRATTVCTLSDWITYRLCGEIATDASQAAESLLLDIETRAWADELVRQLELPRHVLPLLRESGTRLGALTPAAAEALGLRPGTPVAVGGGDTQCGLLGAGAVAPGQVALIAGTTAPVQLVLDRAVIDAQERVWTSAHVVPGRWVMESNAGTMGEALDWFARLFFPDAAHPVARLLAEATTSDAGAAGILSTIGGDVMNARELRAPLGSLTLSHLTTAHDPERRRHVFRALVDGMGCAVRANLDQLRAVAGISADALHVAGGLSRSALFARVVGAVANLPVHVGATGEATALGAALCAAVAAGVYPSLEQAAARFPLPRRTLAPEPTDATAYQELYDGWTRLRAARAEVDTVASQLIVPAVLRDMGRAVEARPITARPRVLVTADMDDAALAALRECGEVEYASFRQMMRLLAGPTLIEALHGVQVFVTEIDVVDAEALRQLPDLRVVAACRGDAVNVDRAACTAYGVPVLYAPGRNADAVADLTVGFLLMLARRLPAATAFLHQPGIDAGDMGRMGQAFTSLQGRELWHKTVGLVGLGAVGRAVARRLNAFGARVVVYDPFVPPEHVVRADAEAVSLETLLAESDFVSLHAAVTDASKGLINADALARMKPGACLVNTARAALVDEAALVDALGSGHLGGAALDVFSIEPPGSDHPLLAFDTVIATPHVGGNTTDVATHQGQMIAGDLRRLLRGEPPQHVLNAEVLAQFDWSQPRPQPSAETLAAAAAQPAPAITDLERNRGAAPPHGGTAAASGAAGPAADAAARMQRIVGNFLHRAAADAALATFAGGKDVTLHFTLTDLGVTFYFRLRDGTVAGDLGEPDHADVELKMRAEIFDGMLTGRVNAMQAATGGKLSFSGDTVKAMTLQQIQADMSRLYAAARAEVGDPGDLSAAAAPAAQPAPAAAQAPPSAPYVISAGPPKVGDIRDELLEVIHELYVAELITATGGNVSVRIPGTDELWITPSALFKGNLRPEILVRIDLEGRPLDPDSRSPSSERIMHCAVYKARPEAQAIIHAHAPHATMLVNAGLPFLPVSTEAAFLGDIPRVPFIMPGTDELAHAVGNAARHSWAVFMQNHGVTVAGRSLRRAADMTEILERSAQVILGCYAVNRPPTTLPDDVVQMLQKMGDLLA